MSERLAPPVHGTGVVDLLKALACSLIVLHHLALYGPMSDHADDLFPVFFDGLAQHGRLAVQVFLVLGGYLAARSFSTMGLPCVAGPAGPGGAELLRMAARKIAQRYVRLAVPLWLALVLAVLCNALADHWIDHHSISAPPQFWQALLHLVMLQDIMGHEALSAGIWYVAVDFQLFALFTMLVMLAQLTRHPQRNLVVMVLTLLALSAFFFNRDPQWDAYGAYFWVSYGLGVVVGLKARSRWLLVAVGLVVLSCLWEPRIRLLVALATVGALWAWQTRLATWMTTLMATLLPASRALSRISYSVFLVHFPIALVVNALWVTYLPHQPFVQLIGVLTAFKLSLVGGWLFHEHLEQPLLNRLQERLFARKGPVSRVA